LNTASATIDYDNANDMGLDFVKPLVNTGDVSQWMLKSQQMSLYDGLHRTIAEV